MSKFGLLYPQIARVCIYSRPYIRYLWYRWSPTTQQFLRRVRNRIFKQRSLTRLILVLFLTAQSVRAAVPTQPTVILVDKKTNSLQVAHYQPDHYEVIKTFHATIGQVVGDKIDEGDFKTPEGIYRFSNYLGESMLKPKFGVMAFYMDYPNPFDQLAGRTGFDIMLHATDDPKRLQNALDSEGCIVVRNEEIQEIRPYIRLGLTPILVFEDLKEEYRQPASSKGLQEFFQSWISAWESKDINRYMDHYHSEFESGGKNYAGWKNYKKALTQKYASISVGPDHIQYYRHPKYSLVVFAQNYHSTLKDSSDGYRSRGTKWVYVAEEEGKLRIISEQFSNMSW